MRGKKTFKSPWIHGSRECIFFSTVHSSVLPLIIRSSHRSSSQSSVDDSPTHTVQRVLSLPKPSHGWLVSLMGRERKKKNKKKTNHFVVRSKKNKNSNRSARRGSFRPEGWCKPTVDLRAALIFIALCPHRDQHTCRVAGRDKTSFLFFFFFRGAERQFRGVRSTKPRSCVYFCWRQKRINQRVRRDALSPG